MVSGVEVRDVLERGRAETYNSSHLHQLSRLFPGYQTADSRLLDCLITKQVIHKSVLTEVANDALWNDSEAGVGLAEDVLKR